MTSARTEDGIEVQWTSSSVPVEQLDAALNRGVYELLEADQQDIFRRAEGSVLLHSYACFCYDAAAIPRPIG